MEGTIAFFQKIEKEKLTIITNLCEEAALFSPSPRDIS
jgi:hypothetical protein